MKQLSQRLLMWLAIILTFAVSGRLHDLAMAIGDNFQLNNITAYDMLSLTDEVGIPFLLLKKRISSITTLALKNIDTLTFEEFELSKENLLTIEEIKKLII